MDTGRIKSVSIKKLWGVKNISTEFNEHVNIFIGTNGSSKTTFLNLIEAALLCDINTLANIEFESIEIELLSEQPTSLRLCKAHNKDDDTQVIKYTFNDVIYEILCNEMMLRSYRSSYSRHKESYQAIKSELSKLINISWLSINRDNTASFEYDRGSREYVERIKNMVDIKLHDLLKKLILYQLQLESEANKSANKFKEDSLSLMLYNESFDIFNVDYFTNITTEDINLMKIELYKAFKVLGVKEKNEQIQTHIKKINDVLSDIKEESRVRVEDVSVLSLIKRTFSIIDIFKMHEEQKKQIFEPVHKFWDCLKRFMPNKTFVFDKENDDNISITLKEGDFQDVPISITSLSSGEKQLFILLTEALLQRGTPHLFIADEPELSLHIEWQRKILSALLDLNPNAQIIVATHSPEIAGNFADNIINMKKITSYE